MNKRTDGIIQDAVNTSIATRNEPKDIITNGFNTSLLLSLNNQSNIVPAWWSKGRDASLRNYWKQIDYLSGAVYTMEAKLTAIPFQILPRDQTNRLHVKQASELTELLNITAQYGNGWSNFYQMFLEDLLTTDNGGFAEVIGDGDPNGPIIGRPITVSHLDSSKCTRTGNKEFPVLYTDDNSNIYKMHYTRVMYCSSMTSPIKEMNGVGFCALSRSINVAQTLLDVLTYKMEKLGSRPSRSMMVTRGGLDPEDIKNAFRIANSAMDNAGLSKFSKTVVAGDASLLEADVKLIELSGLPDGFDEEMSVILGMSAVSLAFGVDLREFWPSTSAGQTRADAIMQHMKQRGKGPGQILYDTERLFNSKYLPPHLYMSFDYQDDAQDRQVAETRNIRAMRRERDLTTGSIDIKTVREIMELDGDISHEQLVKMELQDGRLPDGTSILNTFYSENRIFKELLNLEVDDPLDYNNIDLVELEKTIVTKTKDIRVLISNTPDGSTKNDYTVAFYSLMALAKHYGITNGFPELTEDINQENNTSDNLPWNDNRVRREETLNPTDEETNPPIDDLEPAWDDTENSISR